MTTKRTNIPGADYPNYKVSFGDTIDEISCDDLSSEEFFKQFVKPRRPVKFVQQGWLDVENFQSDRIANTLKYEGKLLVERKFDGGFGGGQEREIMTFDDFVDVVGKSDGYYLTTQYGEALDISESLDLGDQEDQVIDLESEGLDLSEDEDQDTGSKSLSELKDLDGSDELGDLIDSNNLKVQNNLNDTEVSPVYERFQNPGDSDSDSDSFDMENLHDDYDEFNDHDEDDDDTLRIDDLYQKPLTNLASQPEILPLIPPIFTHLIPQQINLWMGSSTASKEEFKVDLNDPTSLGKYIPKGNSSGLHHDHADNLYILVQGRKRFTLFSPADASRLHTIGTIYKVYQSGIIDYSPDENAPNWVHIRDDGAIISEVERWKREKAGAEEEEAVEFDEGEENEQGSEAGEDQVKLSPPNFSKIPPALLHIDEFDEATTLRLLKFAEKYFPGFLTLHKLTVWINPGEMLYLPAGWFHEVSSFSGEDLKIHIALNYWFMPPNLEDGYSDDYWKDDFEKTKNALEGLKG